MKKIITGVVFLAFACQAFSQSDEPSEPPKPMTKQDYLVKSREQRVIGLILLGGGITCLAIASTGDVSFDDAGTLVVVGGLATLGSIPLLLAAGRNKRKYRKATTGLQIEKYVSPHQGGIALRSYPAVSFQIRL